MNKETRTFLASVFPNADASRLELFSDLFGELRWGKDKTESERNAEIRFYDEAIDEIRSLPVDSAGKVKGFAVRRACRNLDMLPEDAKADADNVFPGPIILALELDRDLNKTWYAGNPRKHGANTHANGIAEAVADIFGGLGQPVTSGTRMVNGQTAPSTNFGKVVKYALEYHEVHADWLSPHRTVAKKWRNGWRP